MAVFTGRCIFAAWGLGERDAPPPAACLGPCDCPPDPDLRLAMTGQWWEDEGFISRREEEVDVGGTALRSDDVQIA
jgi:hypothetical protein